MTPTLFLPNYPAAGVDEEHHGEEGESLLLSDETAGAEDVEGVDERLAGLPQQLIDYLKLGLSPRS